MPLVSFNGVPAAAAVPTGAPEADGGLQPALALVHLGRESRAEVDAFLKRHRFAPRGDVAQAKDSQARWSIERDGRVVLSFIADNGVDHVALPAEEGVRRWAALTLATGGTLAVWFLPEMTAYTSQAIGRRIAPDGGEWWRLSAGYVPA
ncbi:hypothetical protein [Streptomyces sp. CB03238]|uniref:hypothetical protein n=1 Tax=Streptomyces sp. CB03238 TaxID=1907777 RepID=UPI00117F48B1|nr:hypothetical protein [Streptomyces sp. CB03238]